MLLKWMDLIMVALLFCTFITADQDDFDEDEDDFSPMVGEKNDRFDWILCSNLDQLAPTNIISSPFNIKFMLVLLYEASIKETAQELQQALGLDNNRNVIRARYGSLMTILQAEHPDYQVLLKSRLFIDKRYGAQWWYQKALGQYYNTYVHRLNFNDAAKAAREINLWAEDATKGAITNIITDDSIKDSESVLVNAVYFKGLWQNPFPREKSYIGIFNSPLGKKTSRFMTQTDLFYVSHSEELDATLLRLPYKGKKFAMYVALPKKVDGLGEMLTKIRPFLLRKLIWQLEQTMVSVTFPIFKYESTLNLKEILMKMRVVSLFSKYDNLIGIKAKGDRGESHLKLSKIVQKATIHVTESGTVATAVTDTRFVNKLNFPPVIFNASHPFMFFIKDEETGTVIFQGKFSNPDEHQINLGMSENAIDLPFDQRTEKFNVFDEAEHGRAHRRKGLLDGSEWEMSKSP